MEILRDLRLGNFDVLVGVNLLREGLDLPEVSLVAILDADKEGFLRSDRSLIQTIGRAARNERGKVVMYADRITDSIAYTLEDNLRKREKQTAYNTEHGIIPTTIRKSREDIMKQTSVADSINRPEKGIYRAGRADDGCRSYCTIYDQASAGKGNTANKTLYGKGSQRARLYGSRAPAR